MDFFTLGAADAMIEAEDRGFDARLQAKPVLCNPYPRNTGCHRSFELGYMAAETSLRTGLLPGEGSLDRGA